MTLTIDILPEMEQGLLAKAADRGLSLTAFVSEIVSREVPVALDVERRRTGQDLVDACAKVRGLLTDDEVDTLFRRDPSFARPVDFE